MKRAVVALALAAGCDKPAPPPHGDGKLTLIEAPAGADLPALVASEVARAARDHVGLVVYVGAAWCEPCVRFHAAAAGGRLDAELPDLRVVVFDADRDDDALVAAGYRSTMIPLFADARADGHAGSRRIEGGVKGDGAVANLTARLRDLLTASSAPGR